MTQVKRLRLKSQPGLTPDSIIIPSAEAPPTFTRSEGSMSSQSGAPSEDEPQPFLQRLFDQPFTLLVLGLVVMLGFYTLWGLYEIASLPPAPLP
jgi:hypothetical protein